MLWSRETVEKVQLLEYDCEEAFGMKEQELSRTDGKAVFHEPD